MLEHLGQSVTVNGVEYKINHLSPFFYTYERAGVDGADLKIRVSFSCHVFSEVVSRGLPFDFLDHSGQTRVFDHDRYSYAKNLPTKVEVMLKSNVLAWGMRDHNGFANMVALTEPGTKVTPGDHRVILFYYYPASADHFDIEMNILTCHYRSVNPTKHKRETLKSLARKCLIEKVKVPKG